MKNSKNKQKILNWPQKIPKWFVHKVSDPFVFHKDAVITRLDVAIFLIIKTCHFFSESINGTVLLTVDSWHSWLLTNHPTSTAMIEL